MIHLSPRERECLDFIRAHVKAHGFSPSFDEIACHLGLASKSTVSRIVDALVAKGFLTRISRYARGLQVVQTKDYHLPDCNCGACAQARYLAQLKLVQGLKVDPPVAVSRARMDNIRLLDPFTRSQLTGIKPARSRTWPALPREAS